MKSASSQLTRISDLECNMFFVYLLSVFFFVQTLFHQICSGLQFWVNQSPGQNCFLTREVLFYFHEMFLPKHGLDFSWIQFCRDGQLYLSCKMDPSKCFHTVLPSVESFAECGSVSLLWFLLLWQFIFQVCQCWKNILFFVEMWFSTGRIRRPRDKCNGGNQVISVFTRRGQPFNPHPK